MVKGIKQNINSRRLRLTLIVVVLLMLSQLPCLVFAQPKKDTLFITQSGEYPVYKHLYIYETDKIVSPQFVLDSVKAGSFIRLFPDKAFNNSTSTIRYYWLMVTLKNDLPNDETFYYWLNSLGLSIVKAYEKTGKKNVKFIGNSGFYTPIEQRQSQSHDAEFHFVIKENETRVILLNIDNSTGQDAFFLPQLSDATTRIKIRESNYSVAGIIAGIMLMAFLLNIFYAISLKENIHYLYALYVLSMLYELFTLEGITENYLGTASPRFAESVIHIMPAVCITLMVKIMQWFLNQKRSNSYFKTFIDIVTYLLAVSALLFVFGYYVFPNIPFLLFLQILQVICIMMQLLLVLASAIEKAIQRYQLAWLYLAAISWLIVGLFEYAAVYLGVNDIEAVRTRHPNDTEIGLMIEVIVVFIAIIYRYNLYKKEKEKLLIEVTQQQQSLIKKIVAAEEEERQRIATDLHDDVGATLSMLNMHIGNVPATVQHSAEVDNYLNHSLLLSTKAAEDIRDIAHNLLPKDFKAAKLFALLQQRIDELNTMLKVRFHLIAEGNEKRLNEIFSIIVYRIINELVTNILKHSLAAEATIQLLIEENMVQIMAEDDGIGFHNDETTDGIGLKNIKRRIEFLKGSILIDGNRNGTHTIIQLPL